MYYGRSRQRREGTKAILSVAAIAAGMLLSHMVARAELVQVQETDTGDIVGVWSWVVEAPGTADPDAPLFEFRRDGQGHLEIRVLARESGRHYVKDARVSFDGDHLCVVAGNGTSFKGELSADGSMIDGVISVHGNRSTAQLRRVELRQPRTAAPAVRRAYAT